MFDINVGIVEIFVFGVFILGSYIKNKFDNHIRTKNVQELFQCSVHLGIALYTIYNINNNNTFNSNIIQETNKMFSHYGKNFGEMIGQVKVKLDEYSENNDKFIEFYKKVVDDVKKTMNEENDTKEKDVMTEEGVNVNFNSQNSSSSYTKKLNEQESLYSTQVPGIYN